MFLSSLSLGVVLITASLAQEPPAAPPAAQETGGEAKEVPAAPAEELPSPDQAASSGEEPEASETTEGDGGAEPAEADQLKERHSASPQLPVQVQLRSGVTLRGTVAQQDLLSWSPGMSLLFTPEGGQASLLAGESLASVSGAGSSPSSAPQSAAETSESSQTQPAEPAAELPPGEFEYPNPAASRYLYAPSSIPLEQGEGYVSQKLVFTSVAYAVSDHLTLLYGAFTFFPPALSVFGAKVGFELDEKVHLSFGGESFLFPIEQTALLNIGFGALTFGDKDAQLTLASGYSGGDAFGDGLPVMVAGQKRMQSNLALVTENWVIIPRDTLAGEDNVWVLINTAALRIIGRRGMPSSYTRLRTKEGHPRTTWDLGLVAIYDATFGDVYAPFPWVDWTWHFGP